MNLLKRVEIWILLAVVVALLVWALRGGPPEEELDEPAVAMQSSDARPLVLHRSSLERDYGNARLEIDLRVKNDSAQKLVMQAPAVKLLAQNREIPGFYLAFEPAPEVAPNATQDVQLRYWLEAGDLKGPLTLEVNGQKVEIKGAQPFDLESLKSTEKKTFTSGSW